MYFQKVAAAAKLTNSLSCRMENTFEDIKGCQGNINSGLLCKGIMVQSLITQPNPRFPLLFSDPSFSSVPEPILGGGGYPLQGSCNIGSPPHNNKHYKNTLSYAAHLKILCLVTSGFSQFLGPPVGHQPNDEESL